MFLSCIYESRFSKTALISEFLRKKGQKEEGRDKRAFFSSPILGSELCVRSDLRLHLLNLVNKLYFGVTFFDGDESGVDHLQLEGAAPHPARPHQHLLPPPRPLLLDLRVSHHALWCKAGQVGGMASSDIHQI